MAKPSGRRTSQFQLKAGQPQQAVPQAMNAFTGGLKTEFTGLNFPENACTATENCLFTRVGNVSRRNGIDFESNAVFPNLGDRTNAAISTFLWENAGGDGLTIVYVTQVGGTVYFWGVTGPGLPVGSPLSNVPFSGQSVTLSTFAVTTFDATQECQYTSGNGYLFIFHPNCDPIYVTYSSGNLTANGIQLQIRDFVGVNDNLAVNTRPPTLSADHQYNLQNQGWTAGAVWNGQNSANDVPITYQTGSQVFPLTSSSGALSNGDIVNFSMPTNTGFFQGGVHLFTSSVNGSGTVTAYTANVSVTLNVTSISIPGGTTGQTYHTQNQSGGNVVESFQKGNTGFITTWFTAEANYPSNSDIWYLFKNASGVFDPATTQPNVALTVGQAPQGHYVFNAFNQNRTSVSGISVTNTTTLKRPSTGAFFEGRVWYTGVNDTQAATGDAFQYTWTENIYFSQIIVDTTDFGLCYQTNDPTSQTLNALLPSDGGVIHIQGSGAIYKLFPVQNGMLVFASNGIWFITGNQGIGFTANDFSITKISGEHAISGKSFVSIVGYPVFWNADGIYMIQPGQAFEAGQRGLEVKNLTLESIQKFYQAIPLSSKKNARGAYNHLTGEVRWLYKSTEATSTLDAYTFDSVLNLLTYTGAFYPWTLTANSTSQGVPSIQGIDYIEGPGGFGVTPPIFKYFISFKSGANFLYSFAEEKDTTHWTDFFSTNGTTMPYTSTFTTAYKLPGQGIRKAQPQYVHIYSEIPTYTYILQGVWDYALSILSNRFSTQQIVTVNQPGGYFAKAFRKHRIRGNGHVLQFKITSKDGLPFNIAGWAVLDTIGIE